VGRLGTREAKQAEEGERALSLLREDGTSAALAESTAQLCDDLHQLVNMFADGDTGAFNRSLQQDVIRTLQEMVDALKRAQRDLEQRSAEQQQQMVPPGEMPLVDLLAEIKMIRTLQLRVNRRTRQYGELLGDRPVADARIHQALEQLAQRQRQVAKITRDLYLKKNQ